MFLLDNGKFYLLEVFASEFIYLFTCLSETQQVQVTLVGTTQRYRYAYMQRFTGKELVGTASLPVVDIRIFEPDANSQKGALKLHIKVVGASFDKFAHNFSFILKNI